MVPVETFKAKPKCPQLERVVLIGGGAVGAEVVNRVR